MVETRHHAIDERLDLLLQLLIRVASAVVRRWDSRAIRPSGSRTASARGWRAVPVNPATVASIVSAWRIFNHVLVRPARTGGPRRRSAT